MYFALKHLHMLCAALSIVGFIARGALKLQGSNLLQKKWLRITPHVVDTVLLLSAAGLVAVTHQYPFVQGWLTAKLIGLVVYIGLGLVALRFAQTQPARAMAYLLAILTFAYIAAVAVTKSALPFIG